MNLADVAETAVIGALTIAGIEPFTRSAIAVVTAVGKARTAKAAAKTAQPATPPTTDAAGAAEEPRAAPAVPTAPLNGDHPGLVARTVTRQQTVYQDPANGMKFTAARS